MPYKLKSKVTGKVLKENGFIINKGIVAKEYIHATREISKYDMIYIELKGRGSCRWNKYPKGLITDNYGNERFDVTPFIQDLINKKLVRRIK